MKVMSFNMQKDRNHSVQYAELLHFMDEGQAQWSDLIVLNEAYYLHPEVADACADMNYGALHANAQRGQNWNAVLWDREHWDCLDRTPVLLTKTGYQNTPPRWAARVLLQKKTGGGYGERVLLYGLHYPPSWEWGIKTNLVRERVALAKEMDVSVAQDLRRQRLRHPKAHVMVVGDFNCSSLSRGNRFYPARFYPDALGLYPSWTKERAKACGIRRPIDDVYRSQFLTVKNIELAGFEKSDHEPPIVTMTIRRHLR